MKARRLLFVFFLAALPTFAFGQTFSTPIRISVGSGEHSPEMHIGRDGAINITWFQSNANIFFSRSVDRGATFSLPVRVSKEISKNQYTSLLQRAPEFAIDTKGTIHLIWMEGRIPNPITKQEQTDIWYARSTDNGATWSQPLSIMDPDDSTLYAQDFPAIACDSSDNLYVSYLDNRYLMRGLGRHYRMHLQRSTDGGATWSLPVIADKLPMLASGTCECCRQDIVASPTGTLYIAFRTNMETQNVEKRDIFICRSRDKGLTFDSSIRVQLGGWTLTGCPTKGPHISLDASENLHLAWSDARDDIGKLTSYYTMLRAGESTINANYSISNSNSQAGQWPDVTAGAGGILATAFMPQLNGSPVQFTYSSDGGNTWKRSMQFPGASSDDQELPIIRFAPDGSLYTVWQDGDKSGIMFASIAGLPTSQMPGAVTSLIAKNFQAGKRILLQWSKPKSMGAAQFVRYMLTINSNPTIELQDTAFTLDSLPAGNYTYQIKAKSIIGESSTNGTFAVQAPASVGSNSEEASALYPNPSRGGSITIKSQELGSLVAHCRIVNSLGVTAWSGDVQASNGELSLLTKGLAKGVYQCQLEFSGKHWQSSIVIE